MIDDPKMTDLFDRVSANYWDTPLKRATFKEAIPYMMDQAWFIVVPDPYVYTVWSPWLKDYHGAHPVGFCDYHAYAYYIWMDQDMKEEMTGRR